MKRTTRFAAAAAAAALTAALLPGAVASGNTGNITGGGVLRLHMGFDGDFVRFQPVTGSGESPLRQKLSSKKCAASLSPASSLVTLSSTPAPPDGVVGLFDHSLGVKSKAESSYSPTCGQVNGTADPSEALTLALGDSLTGKKIDFAELDIEAFGAVTVRADTYLDGTLKDTTLLPIGSSSGKSTSAPKSGVTPQWNKHTNVRWLLNPPSLFDKVVFSVDSSTPEGAFQLEGGLRGTPPVPGGLGASLHTSDSVFQLSDFSGTLDCGASTGDVGDPGQPGADLTRGENADCKPIPFLLRTGIDTKQFVLLQKDLTGQDDANFTMEITWVAEHAQNPLPPTTIDYDGPGGADPTPVVFCGGTSSDPIPVEGQAWCVFKQNIEVVGKGQVQLTEDYFGSGDPRWAR